MTSEVSLMLLAGAVSAAYVCRVDRLSWRGEPVQMLLHALGGIASVWVLTNAATGRFGVMQLTALCASTALLVITYRRLPQRTKQSQLLDSEDLRSVVGGSDK